MEIFELVTCLEELIDLNVVKTNLYAQQKGRNFIVDNNELKAFLGINYIMAINKLPTIVEYWITVLYFLISAAFSQIFNPIAEFLFPIGIPSREAKAEIEKHPVNVEAKTRKCSI